jgi:hypothetical protein
MMQTKQASELGLELSNHKLLYMFRGDNRERNIRAFNSTVSDRMSEFREAIPELDGKNRRLC